MRLLSVTSELFPLIKTGGLADVAGALPLVLQSNDTTVYSLLPGYRSVMAALSNSQIIFDLPRFFGGAARLLRAKSSSTSSSLGLDLFILDAPHLYDRAGGPYLDEAGVDWPDNGLRFAALCRMAALIAQGSVADFQPDIIHCHDWQAGLTPAYLFYQNTPVKTVFTLHNLAFSGRFPAQIFPALHLPPQAFSVSGVEFYGDVSYLKAGISFADAITTVSPSYAHEILSAEMGMGFEGLLRQRQNVLSGIPNGIDTKIWNPAKDKALAKSFSARSIEQRLINKRALEAHFHLDSTEGPLFCLISRLTHQKGIDLVIELIPQLIAKGGRLIILGSGDRAFEAALRTAAATHAGLIGFSEGYNEPLSHLMQGGADVILVPSRFEPCGLTQLYGLRYGCIPLVARVGGLADTVIDANDAAIVAGVATGFQFSPVNLDAFSHAFHRCLAIFSDKSLWRQLQANAMASDVSWARSAAQYISLYRHLLDRHLIEQPLPGVK